MSGSPRDRPDIAYGFFTDEFDVECRGSDLEQVIYERALHTQMTRLLDGSEAEQRISQFQAHFEKASKGDEGVLFPPLTDTAISLLIDQSGSMAQRMPWVAGQVLAAAQQLENRDASVMVAGFTSLGWNGGRSRQKWLETGCPSDPGRLCDLLHVIYSDFGEAITPDLLTPLLGQALFENVDGEAIRWALKRLEQRPEQHRILLVLSDGAPVDDSTLQVNGPRILERDVIETIASVSSDSSVLIGAIGLEFAVSRYYPHSLQVDNDGPLAEKISELVASLAQQP